MEKFEMRTPPEEKTHFEKIRLNETKVVINGEGLETDGLFACISIAGSFDGEQNIAFITHRAAQNIVQNLTDAINIANRYQLRGLTGTLFIFRKDKTIAPPNDFMIDGVRYTYQGLVERIRNGLSNIFKKANVIEVNYGDSLVADSGSATVDLKNKKYKTDIEEGVF